MSQFSDNGEEHRCCCELCHVKTATTLIGVVESCFLFYLIVNSVVLISTVSDHGGGLEGGIGGPHDPWVQGPFIAAMIMFVLGIVAVLLLFLAITKKIPALLLPHFVLQVLSIPLLLALVVGGILALVMKLTWLFRLLNAVAFTAAPEEETVALGTAEWVGFLLCFSAYCALLLLQLPASVVVWRAFRYLQARREYVKYIQQYSMPLHAAANRGTMPVPTYYHGNTLYLNAKRASDS